MDASVFVVWQKHSVVFLGASHRSGNCQDTGYLVPHSSPSPHGDCAFCPWYYGKCSTKTKEVLSKEMLDDKDEKEDHIQKKLFSSPEKDKFTFFNLAVAGKPFQVVMRDHAKLTDVELPTVDWSKRRSA
uniref:Uncharacterized protein n=1 Tax=Sphaerodactylus townsendi TaxID=933632 RepID=A0ACB8EC15_9SAUR